jgi:hypothetical protein
LGERLSRAANAKLFWALHPSRVEITTTLAAALFTLGLVLVGRWRLCPSIRAREQPFYFQPMWCRGIPLFLIPALLLATTPVQAAFTPGYVLYYYHTDQVVEHHDGPLGQCHPTA